MACYVVTGGAGFIGSHTAEALLRHGHTVRIFDNLSTGRRQNLEALERVRRELDAPESALAVHQGTLLDQAEVASVVRGADGVLHFGALPSVQRSWGAPLDTHNVNAVGTLHVLLAARDAGVRRVVLASSSSVYGNPPDLAPDAAKVETAKPQPASPYAVSKLTAEKYCRVMHEVYGLESVMLRYFNVFGERQDPASEYAAVIPRFIIAAAAGRPVEIHGDGEQSRDFTYIDNVVHANLLALEAPGAAGAVCNLGAGQRTSVNQLVDAIEALHGAPIERRHSAPRPGDVRHSLAGLATTRAVLGYEPQVPFLEGLRRTHEAFIRRN